MVDVRGALRGPGRRRQAREGLEVVDQVSLVEITAVNRQLAPVHEAGVVRGSDRALKAPDAAEDLRRQAHFSGEQLDEAALAEAGCRADVGDSARMGHVREFPKRVIHRPVVRHPLAPPFEQHARDDVASLIVGPGFADLLAQLTCNRAPQRIEGCLGVAQLE